MPLFRMKLKINQDTLQRIKDLPDRARRNVYTTARTQLVPELEQTINELMVPGPSPVSSPFQFGTEKSRRYWFFLIDTGQVETDGNHYIRSGDIETSFKVEAAGNVTESLFRIFNAHPKAKYLFGPWLVAGHDATGWPEQAEAARQLLQEKANTMLLDLWRSAVRAAIQGIDL